ncbi:MAG: hypothetical protein ACI4BD_05955 [Paludibacteraceae bacterium]
MARTVEQIKASLTEAFMQDTNLADKYGFSVGDDFNNTFSKVSIESLLLYIVAATIWTLEKIFDTHTAEVTDYIAAMKPHTLRWYQEKAKAFLYGLPLIAGTDQYDTAGMTDEQIEKARIIRFAAVSESESTLYLKLATTDNDGNPAPLSDDQRTAFTAYLAEYKDAGVRVDVTSVQGDYLRLDLTIYYDPILLNANGESKQTGNKPVEETVKQYIENLPFNAEYRNNDLVDALQKTEGVRMVTLNNAEQSVDGTNYRAVEAYTVPYAGYFKYDRDNIPTIRNITYKIQ